jgi:excisionase family DNA binding protein
MTGQVLSAAKRSLAEIKASSLVYDVPEAGAKLGLSRNGSYEAAARGEIPTIRIGRLLKVPKAAFDRMLEQPAKAS